MSIGSNLKEIRKDRGVTQKQLADAIGSTQLQVTRWENDTQKMNAEFLKKICEFLKVSSDIILDIDF